MEPPATRAAGDRKPPRPPRLLTAAAADWLYFLSSLCFVSASAWTCWQTPTRLAAVYLLGSLFFFVGASANVLRDQLMR